MIDEESRVFLVEVPLRGAALWNTKEGECCFQGSLRCAGLHDCQRERLLFLAGELPRAARGCMIDGKKRMFLVDLPLHDADA